MNPLIQVELPLPMRPVTPHGQGFSAPLPVFFSVFFLSLIFLCPSIAQAQKNVSSRLEPLKNEPLVLQGAFFSFGGYYEILSPQTQLSYTHTDAGMVFGFKQKLRTSWIGGLEGRWSHWKKRTPSDPANNSEYLSPLSLLSKIEFLPTTAPIFGPVFGDYVHPFLTGGLGYSVFFENRSFGIPKLQGSSSGEPCATYGVGVRFHVNPGFGMVAALENWRGLKTSSYQSTVFALQIVLGDI